MNILQLDANFTQNGVDIIYVGIFSKIIKVFFFKASENNTFGEHLKKI